MINQNKTLEQKKARLLNKDKRRLLPVVLTAICVAVVLAGVLLYPRDNQPSESEAAIPAHLNETGSQISYPVDMFNDARAVHFEYTDGSLKIRYFVLKSSDGVLRAAFDACDVCWPSGKGYFQEGDHMVCRNCGQRFSSLLINQVRGGCNPEPLARSVVGDRLVIRVEDILAGRKYFDF